MSSRTYKNYISWTFKNWIIHQFMFSLYIWILSLTKAVTAKSSAKIWLSEMIAGITKCRKLIQSIHDGQQWRRNLSTIGCAVYSIGSKNWDCKRWIFITSALKLILYKVSIRSNRTEGILSSKMLIFKRDFHKLRVLQDLSLPQNS